MKRRSWLLICFLASLATATVLLAQSRKAPIPVSEDHRVDIAIAKTDSTRWVATVSLTNTVPIAALTLPFQWGSTKTKFTADSATYDGLRTEYFALKTFHVDSLEAKVLIGLVADLGGNLPPLEPGSGPIARLHFTRARAGKDVLTLDTTFVKPHNILQLVTPEVTSIRPTFSSGLVEGVATREKTPKQ